MYAATLVYCAMAHCVFMPSSASCKTKSRLLPSKRLKVAFICSNLNFKVCAVRCLYQPHGICMVSTYGIPSKKEAHRMLTMKVTAAAWSMFVGRRWMLGQVAVLDLPTHGPHFQLEMESAYGMKLTHQAEQVMLGCRCRQCLDSKRYTQGQEACCLNAGHVYALAILYSILYIIIYNSPSAGTLLA